MQESLIYRVIKHIRTVGEAEIFLDSLILYEGPEKSEAEIAFTGCDFGFGETAELFVFNDVMDKLVRHYERTT